VKENGYWENIIVRENLKEPVRFRGMQKIKSIIDYEIIILVDRDFISIKHPAATAITYSNLVFGNEYYDKLKKPKNGFCLVKEDGPDVIGTHDPHLGCGL
jgi:hypothetical protein